MNFEGSFDEKSHRSNFDSSSLVEIKLEKVGQKIIKNESKIGSNKLQVAPYSLNGSSIKIEEKMNNKRQLSSKQANVQSNQYRIN